MAEAEHNFAENIEQQNFALADSEQHDLTVDELDQQNIAVVLHDEYNFPENDSANQSLVGHEQNFADDDPEHNFEMVTEQIDGENDDEQASEGEQPGEGLDGIEVKQEIPEKEANQTDDAPDDSHVDKKEERENSLLNVPEEKKWPGWPGESVFRLIVPGQKVGNIMGRKGEYIKKIVGETRARIKVMDGPPGSQERAVMVSAKEVPEADIPPAINGLLRVHKRIVDGLDDDSQAPPAGTKVSTKFLVPATQAGSLIGKQGATVKTIQESASCVVRVLGQGDLPKFALEDDRVVEVLGEPANVHKAVELIATHLRKFLVDRGIIAVFEKQMQSLPQQPGPWDPPHGMVGHGYGPGPQYMAPPPRHDNYYPPADLPPLQHHQGISAYGREPPLSSQIPSNAQSASSITQVTQHMQVPLQYADSVIGANGSTISYIRRASGATVTVQETRGIPGEMTVEINGTTPQVQAAQQLVQTFMAEAVAAAGATQTGGAAAEQGYSQGYASYAAPPTSVYAPPATGAQPGAYGMYGGSYGY